jgi:hypothetical protein
MTEQCDARGGCTLPASHNMGRADIPDNHQPPTVALVILFKPSGKYYTSEEWRIPAGAIGPFDMKDSPDFRRIGGGAVLVETQEPWGYPQLFPGDGA